MFETELQYIEHSLVRRFGKELIGNVKHLITGPSSITGKHHPVDEFCEEGAYIHARRVCWWVNELCREANIKGIIRDYMIVAAMVHDIGRHLGSKRKERHGPRGAEYMTKIIDCVNQDLISFVERHMWHWDTASPQPYRLQDQVFCFADYCASRREIITPFLKEK